MFRYKNYVYEVYKERSISKAAANLYISQPSLSARIIKVEEELGMPIFDRSTSPLRLTEFGEFYIKAIEQINGIEKSVEGFIDDMSALRAGELTIGASNVYAAYTLPPIIADFKKEYPDVKINLVDGNSDVLESLLSTNKVDMIIGNGPYDQTLYDREMYYEDKILLAVPKIFKETEDLQEYSLDEECIRSESYKNESCPAIPLSAFKRVPFILLKPNNDTRARADKMCKAAGFRPTVALEVHQQATAYMIATTNMGATFISDILVHKMPSFENMSYYKIDSVISDRELYFYFKRNKYKTRAMLEFMRFVSPEQ